MIKRLNAASILSIFLDICMCTRMLLYIYICTRMLLYNMRITIKQQQILS